MDFAARYDLEIYKNGDKTASQRRTVCWPTTASRWPTRPRRPLPVSDTPYVWRVRRVDADRRKGAWSDWGSFVVTGTAPELVSPSSSARTSSARDTSSPGAPSPARRRTGSSDGAAGSTSSNSRRSRRLAWRGHRRSCLPDGILGSGGSRPTTSSGAADGELGVAAPSTSTDPAGAWSASRRRGPPRGRRTSSRSSASRCRYVTGTTMKLYVKGQQHPLTAKVTLSSDRRTATLNPTRNLRAGKFYTVKLCSSHHGRRRQHAWRPPPGALRPSSLRA